MFVNCDVSWGGLSDASERPAGVRNEPRTVQLPLVGPPDSSPTSRSERKTRWADSPDYAFCRSPSLSSLDPGWERHFCAQRRA
jgi:hypothetical protein